MIVLALDSEKDAVARFNAAAKECRELGDHGTASVFDEMVLDEEKHVDWFEAQLGAIERVGAPPVPGHQIPAGEAPDCRPLHAAEGCLPTREAALSFVHQPARQPARSRGVGQLVDQLVEDERDRQHAHRAGGGATSWSSSTTAASSSIAGTLAVEVGSAATSWAVSPSANPTRTSDSISGACSSESWA